MLTIGSNANPRSVPSSPTSAVFTGLDDELLDARRVLAQGQEEDLRYALGRTLSKVEEFSSLLKTAIKTQTELETQLNLAKSNLQLVISNNEMLEEALKRETPCSAKDVGWRRWSAREVQNYNANNKSEDRPRSLDYGPLNESGKPATPADPATVLVNGVKPPSTAGPAPPSSTPLTGQENRFFRFRFSSSNSSRSPSLSPHPSHLTSPSLSSLVPNAREKEMEDLQEQLERERQAHKDADVAKAALEAELESLSQALFEEANKMVATERMKRAETEEELNQTLLEKDALRQALKLVEGENDRLRSANVSSAPPLGRIDESDLPLLHPLPKTSTGEISSPRPPSYDSIPSHTTDFVLEPAPKPSLHRRTLSMEKVGTTELTVDSLKESLPVIAASPSLPVLPNEPSPWADATA